MSTKPDRITAMQQIIYQAKRELPLYESDTFVCGTEGNLYWLPQKVNGTR